MQEHIIVRLLTRIFDFLCDLCGKIRIFRCVRVVFRNFCYHGVIMILLHPNIFLRFLTYNTHMGYIAYS